MSGLFKCQLNREGVLLYSPAHKNLFKLPLSPFHPDSPRLFPIRASVRPMQPTKRLPKFPQYSQNKPRKDLTNRARFDKIYV